MAIRLLTRWPVWVALLAAASAALIAGAVVAERFPGDLAIARAVQALPGGWFGSLMDAGEIIGEVPALAALGAAAAALLLARRSGREALIVALAASWFILDPILKAVVGRPRPDPELVAVAVSASGFGFPSGHVYGATVVFGSIFLLADRIAGGRPALGFLVRAVMAAMFVVVALSRVYLGVHWPSDVLGAAVIGALGLTVVFRLAAVNRPASGKA